jgi:hypothetical protein
MRRKLQKVVQVHDHAVEWAAGYPLWAAREGRGVDRPFTDTDRRQELLGRLLPLGEG